MAIIANGLPVNTASSLPQAAPAAVSLALPGENPSAARLLLPQAVAALPTVQAFAANVATPPKPVLRSTTNASPTASPLAAQFIAQDAGSTDEELAIFSPPPTPPPAPQNEARSLIDSLRQARGDAPDPANRQTVETSLAAIPAAANPANVFAQPIRINTAAVAQANTTLNPPSFSPAPRINNLGRKPGLADANGPEAYRLAVSRNTGALSNLAVVG